MGNSTTKVVFLGTGNPNPDPEHQGCAALILDEIAQIYDGEVVVGTDLQVLK